MGKFKVSYDCHSSQNQMKLESIGVSVKNDRKNVHPSKFCHSCYNVCTRSIKARTDGKDYTPRLSKFEWVEHTEGDCTVCTHFGEVKRGRKPKKTSSGRPPQKVVDLVASIRERSPPSLLLDRERLVECHSDLKCPLCQLVVDRPLLLTTCNKLACLTCCVSYIYQHTDLSCPICGLAHILDKSTIIPAPPAILILLQSLRILCERCGVEVPAGL